MVVTDAIEEPSPSSNFSQPPSRHFYVTVVDRPHFKMETLVRFLGVVVRRPALPIVVCCTSRDQLNAVCSTISTISTSPSFLFPLWYLTKTYLRRIATCLAADGIVINVAVGGEVITLKNIEESSRLIMAEMPINLLLWFSLGFFNNVILPTTENTDSITWNRIWERYDKEGGDMMGATLVNDNMANVELEIDFSWSKTYRLDLPVTEGC
ncbi:hypothetical protein NC651_018047 [Populus alba x Populus x berolinensis]|nr:hypothetical protein NC651_018047 [Populus alba x Populus x berolinensis]